MIPQPMKRMSVTSMVFRISVMTLYKLIINKMPKQWLLDPAIGVIKSGITAECMNPCLTLP